MTYYVIKLVITSVLIVMISELAKRNSLAGAVLASIPLVSVIAMAWLYTETKDVEQVSALASNIFWMVLPSLALFIIFPVLVKANMSFYPAMGLSILATLGCYAAMLFLLRYFGISLN